MCELNHTGKRLTVRTDYSKSPINLWIWRHFDSVEFTFKSVVGVCYHFSTLAVFFTWRLKDMTNAAAPCSLNKWSIISAIGDIQMVYGEIWSILFWGAVSSCCAGPGDQIQIFMIAFGRGHWLDINLVHVFVQQILRHEGHRVWN